MTIRTAMSWVLIIFALGLSFFLFVKPALRQYEPETVLETDLALVGRNDDGVKAYYHFKEEVKDWLKILAPVIGFLVAYLLKGKK